MHQDSLVITVEVIQFNIKTYVLIQHMEIRALMNERQNNNYDSNMHNVD